MITGLLLAAGAGRRAGGPKASRTDPDGGSRLRRSVDVLLDGGCDDVLVVLGAGAEQAQLIIADHPVIIADDWAEGIGASLRTGLTKISTTASEAALIHLVDLPDVTAAVINRVLSTTVDSATALARAVYQGRPGHPVLIGRDHWPALITELRGDQGARAYLQAHQVVALECGDLAGGSDHDS